MAGVKSANTTMPFAIDPRPYICGGVAAVIAEMATFPLDTAKTRQQLQGQVGDRRWNKARYRGIIHTLTTIAKEEGVASIYRGLSPALVRQAVYGTIKFGLYYTSKDVTKLLVKTPQASESTLVNLCCAVFAGSVSSALANPTDVIKVRMQSGVSDCHSSTLLSTATSIYSTEGVRGLWRGVCPTSKRAALVAGVQLPVYDWTKAKIMRSNILGDGAPCHLLASLVAGLSACLASNPVDVVRTRMMVQRRFLDTSSSLPSSFHTSAIKCGMHTVKTEGFAALYKGFMPAFARMGPWNVIFFLVYEKLVHKTPYIGR